VIEREKSVTVTERGVTVTEREYECGGSERDRESVREREVDSHKDRKR
jgi:hypothetical protein